MKIDSQISLVDFCNEMQHRVVRYSLRSIAVRSAVRFAKNHENPEFYRVAMNKVHAQRLFQRELNGPGMFDKLFDYFSVESLREIVAMLLLVGLTVLGLDKGRKFINGFDRKVPYENMDVDQIAKRLGIQLEDSGAATRPASRTLLLASSHVKPVTVKSNEKLRNTNSDSDIARIVDAVLLALKERAKTEIADNVSTPLAQKGPEQSAFETNERSFLGRNN